jgi:hypothetical protein
MTYFLSVVSFVGTLLVLGLAVFGALRVVGILSDDAETRRVNVRARDAERRIQDLGHQAQLRIMREAFRRAGRRGDRSGASEPDGWDQP